MTSIIVRYLFTFILATVLLRLTWEHAETASERVRRMRPVAGEAPGCGARRVRRRTGAA